VAYSRFYLTDLQVHTPADGQQGYGDAGGRDPNAAFATRLIQAHADAGVEVMAVSDHNRVDWYPALRSAGDELGVFVFPALEFSVNKCHLLAIWDRTDEGHGLANQFLTTLWKPGDPRFESHGDPRPVARGQVLELAQAAIEHKALVLAPHSTLKDIGLFASGVCTNRRDVVRSGLIAGYDVWGNRLADILKNPASDFGDQSPSWFISGDVRRFEDIGKRAVYLKLGDQPTLEGLRQAFLVPATRIRFPEALRPQFGQVVGVRFAASVKPDWPRIGAVSVEGGFHDKLSLEFAPGLNAVIGGKGTGKSTLIEILRYALHAGEPLGVEAKGNREHNFRANAEVSITFVDGVGDAYEVRRSGSKDPARLTRAGEELAVAVPRRVTARVFGQRELQTLAERPDVLREFVAAEGGAAWSEALTEERKLVAALKELDSDLQAIEVQLSTLEEESYELTDLTDRINNANARGVGDLIERLSALGDAHDKVQLATAWPKRVREAVGQLADVLPVPEVPDVPSQHDAIRSSLDMLGEAVAGAVAGLTEAVEQATEALAGPASDWQTQRSEERSTIERMLADAGLADARELGRLQSRARELQGRLKDLPSKRDRAAKLGESRATALQGLGDLRRRKSRLVEEAARTLNERVGQRVRIRVDPLSDRSALLALLERSVKGQSVKTDQLRRLTETQTPSALAAAMREGPTKTEALGCSAVTASKLCALDAGIVRAVEEADIPDRILIEVDLGGDNGDDAWHDVAEVSPGQRAMAVLALALAGGREPLIIDQPEDDLDNRYIYDEVVRVLADVCQSRQVIVATHNANIPILGDAELVLALEAEAARGSVLACGGLEDPTVAMWARKILEGGEEAFQARHRRYQAAGS
jgi:ABC-type lipoprotein export system ATPase subunit